MVLKPNLWMIFSFVIAFSISHLAYAEILYEAYSRLTTGSQQIGYVIQRLSREPRTGHLLCYAYLRSKPISGLETVEMLKAKANSKLEPLSYSYVRILGEERKTIEGTVNKGKLTVKIREGKKLSTAILPVDKEAFFSSFLIYDMMQSEGYTAEDGFKKGTKYTYTAINEEDVKMTAGEAVVESSEIYKGHPAARIHHKFAGTEFDTIVTPTGQVLLTQTPASGLSIEVMGHSKEAISHLSFNEKEVRAFFGDLPLGQQNVIAQSDADKWKSLTQPAAGAPGKAHGVPGGKGLMIKGTGQK